MHGCTVWYRGRRRDHRTGRGRRGSGIVTLGRQLAGEQGLIAARVFPSPSCVRPQSGPAGSTMPSKKARRSATVKQPEPHGDDPAVPVSPVVSDDEDGAPFAGDLKLDGDIEYIGDESDFESEASGATDDSGDDSGGEADDAAGARENAAAADDDDQAPQQEHPRGEESDSSSDGDFNPVGDVPMRWYEGYDHIGYNRDGERIIPENRPSALDLAADPHAWRRIYDEKNDTQLVLSHDELRAIVRMRAGRYPRARDDPAVDEVIAWSGPVEQHPLSSAPEPKRRFLPSRHEARAVVKMVRAMRSGKLRRPSDVARERAAALENEYNHDVWEAHEPKDVAEMSKSERAREIMRVAAPKVALPKHDESYNPPEEYLPTAEEKAKWEATDPEDRVTNYLPTKHDSLRHVPLYENYIKERFERCLDLYLAVRVRQDTKRVNPEDLIPELPSPRDLRPFPSGRSASFGPLPSRARSISVHPVGLWLLSGSDDGGVRLWEVATGCPRYTWWLGKLVPKVDGGIPPVTCVTWAPVEASFVFAASIGNSVFIVSAAEALGASVDESHAMMAAPDDDDGTRDVSGENGSGARAVPDELSWSNVVSSESDEDADDVKDEKVGRMLRVDHPRPLRMVTWHHKADYFATVGKDSTGGTVAIHRLSKRSSQMPFKKKTAGVQTVRFHPTRPFFFVATMHSVRIYNLAAQEAVKTLKPGVRWISSLEIHSSGDHVLVGSYDKRMCWFDLDMSVRPYKTMRNHSHAVRSAKFHPRLPLFASCADDGSAHVFHGAVYDDLNKNALIVPLKKLERYHDITNSLGILDIAWHPRLPWLFTSGADGQLHMFSDLS
jgi:ribosome biogenesis protein ERB1